MGEITLSVLRCPDNVVPEQRRAAGGEISLGRGAECDWPLADPDRVLSKKHCVVEFFGGGWQVRDTSTNGTFVNHAAAPVGRDQTRPLMDGDRLRLGAYEIEVRIAEDARAAPAAGGWGGADPFAGDPVGAPPSSAGFGGGALPGLGPPAASAGGGGGLLPDDFDPFGPDSGPMPDHAPATAEAFMVPPANPAGKSVIPDDWDLDLGPTPAPPPRPAPRIVAPAAAPVMTPPPVVAPAPPPMADLPDPFAEHGDAPPPPMPVAVAPPMAAPTPPAAAPGDSTAALAAFLGGAGLSAGAVRGDPEATLRAAGAALRAAVAGIRALLIARADVKREFRIEQTMLRAAGNNPLKFAATEEQALTALLDPRGAAEASMRETVDDLTAHQVAALAATQAAARALLERLAPGSIEAEDPGGGLLPGAKEKRLWEAYKRRHAQLAEQFEDDFDSAFGKAFARAYEGATGKRNP